ncbi:MAG: GAF domain-containing protein, partial [Chloroflexi bacterium]|nr:GAF domain-containing protein [Chloroflexota bacterium]
MSSLQYGMTLFALSVALIAAGAYLILALQYRDQPFVGVLLDQDMEVRALGPFTNEVWPGREIGIEEGDEIIGVEGNRLNTDDAYTDFANALDDFAAGDTLQLTIARDDTTRGIAQADSCQLSGDMTEMICQVSVGLDTFPMIDFAGYFLVGYITGVIALLISITVLWRRIRQLPARLFATSGACLAILTMGTFNLLTTHEPVLIYVWALAGTTLAGVLVSFSMVFPTRMAIVQRIPSIHYGPIILGLVASVAIFALLQDNLNALLLATLGLVGAGTLIMLLMTMWRRQYTTSPIFHEQASYVSIGAFFGLTPSVFWVIYQMVSQGEAPLWTAPLIAVISLLFLASIAYAILQRRLLETDRLVPTILVYNILGWTLIFAYAGVVTGLSSIGIDFVESESPIFIAIVVLIIAMGFVPIRNRLHERIDQIWFRKRHQYQHRIDTLTTRLTNAITLADVEQSVRSEIEEALATSEVVLFVRDNETQVFRAHEHTGTGHPVTDVIFEFNAGLPQYLTTQSSMLYLEDTNLLPPLLMQNRSQLAILNTPVIVRLMGQRQLNGFLAIGERRSGENFTYEDLRFVERVADQAALALERSQIVEDLEHRFRVQDVLSQVSRALSFAIDFDTLMELLYAQTIRVIDADVFSIAIVEESTNQLYYAFFVEGEERLEHLEGKRWSMGRDLISEIAQTQELLRTDDFVGASYQRNPNESLMHTGLKAWMGTPLTADTASGTLGVMAVGTTDPTIRYSDEQVQLFLDIASIAASAINKT